MKNKIFLIVLLLLTGIVNAVTVYTLDEQFSQSNQTVLRFRVDNTSNDTLDGVELRYHVIQDTSNIANPDLYFLPGGMANWSFEDSVNATLVIYFPNIILYPGDTLGGLSGFAIGLHNRDWSIWTKNDDPSQPVSNTFSIANNVEIVSSGNSLMLDAGKYTGCPVMQFVEVEKDSVSLQFLQVFFSDTSMVVIKNTNDDSVIVVLDAAVTDSLGQKIWRGYLPTQDSVERRGELRAECNGNLLAYFAYGWSPVGAEEAVSKSLWETSNAFVKADFDMGFNQGLIEGQRLALQRDSLGRYSDARRVTNWSFYRAWELPGENKMPVVLSQFLMQYDESDIDSLTLEWSAVDGVDLYHLVVIAVSMVNDSVVFDDTIVSMPVEQTFKKVATPTAGDYIWYVEPLVEVAMDEEEEGVEYYYVNGNQISLELRRGAWSKFMNWAKETGERALDLVAPAVKVIKDASSGNIPSDWHFFKYAWNLLKERLNPFGVIRTYVHSESLYTKTVPVPKNMDLLQDAYLSQYVYTLYPEHLDEYYLDKCFGSSAFCAMKDTRMLAEKWEIGKYDDKNWNKIFPKYDYNKQALNEAVSNRCWLTMAQMINHKKGGNIASDEILYSIRQGFENTDGGGPLETMNAVNYALNQNVWDQTVYTSLYNVFNATGSLPLVDGWSMGTPMLHTIIATIELGNVIGVSQLNGGAQGAHSMVLNGYKINTNGDVYIHLLNADNMGTSEWRYYCNLSFYGIDIVAIWVINGIGELVDRIRDDDDANLSGNMFFSYYIPPISTSARQANESIFNDSDNDGIVDFDEIERFGTEPLDSDSDDDEKGDWQEIFDFMKCFDGANYVKMSDIDGDGLLAARDKDSDGDGYCDDQEEAYLGVLFVHNCERFDAAKHPDGVEPGCIENDYALALLARERLLLNDRSSCVSMSGTYCPVASYESNYNGAYGVSVGVNASVGNVYSAKSVLLRDRAKVYGNIETAGSVIRQSSTAVVEGNINDYSSNFTTYVNRYASVLNDVSVNADYTILYQHAVNSDEIVYSSALGANDEYNFNSNASLQFNLTGNLFVGSLKFQNGATLYAPNESAIFHIGNDFQWNGTVETDDMISAAQHIMVYYYGTNRVFVQTDFAGTIIAPNAEVVVGQSGKNFYGSVFAKSIVVHQNTKITWVPFVFTQPRTVAMEADELNLNYTVKF